MKVEVMQNKIKISAKNGAFGQVTFISPEIIRCEAGWTWEGQLDDTYMSDWEIQDGDEVCTMEDEDSFRMKGSRVDYLVFFGEPMETVQQMWKLTGPAVMLPKWTFGFWQSKMRYTSQDELLAVGEKYREKQYPADIMVVDFYHWTQMGDFTFDRKDWPDPEGMMDRLSQLHFKCMVSVWPHVSTKSFNYNEMKEKGYFLKDDKGETVVFPFFNGDDNSLYDPFSELGAGKFIFREKTAGMISGQAWFIRVEAGHGFRRP